MEVLEDRLAPAVFTVTSLLSDAAIAGTLANCIQQANATAGQDTIDFAVTGTISLDATLPTVTDALTIQGSGAASLTVARSSAAGTPQFRLLTINSGVAVSITGLTLSNGEVTGAGGAIFNAGSLSLTNCVLSNNTARGAGGAGSDPFGTTGGAGGTVNGLGGAVFTTGALTVLNCSFEGNLAEGGQGGSNVSFGTGGGGGGLGAGGAIYVGGGSATIDASLFATNTAQGGNGGLGGPGPGPFSTGAPGNGGGGNGGQGGDRAESGDAGQEGGGGGGAGSGGLTFVGGTGGAGGFGAGGGGGGAGTSGGAGGANGFGAGAGGFGGAFGGGGGGGGGAGLGGAIANRGGALTVRNTTFSANVARGGNGGAVEQAGFGQSGGGGGGLGGALFSDGTTSLDSNTLTANQAVGGTAGGFFGSGPTRFTPGSDGTGQGGGHYHRAGALGVQNTIVSGNSADADADLFGTIGSGGSNLIGGSAGLQPLADNGGLTRTHALTLSSPAVNAGATTLTADQRGQGRPSGGAADIGAFELFINAPPSGLVLSATPDLVGEGAPVTVFGTFADSEANQQHFVEVFWGDGTSTQLTLGAGVFQFSAQHVYVGPLYPTSSTAEALIYVLITDEADLSTSAAIEVTVVNVAPEVSAGDDEFLNVGQFFTRNGSFTDSEVEPEGEGEGQGPGRLFVSYTATVDYGDGTGVQSLTLNTNGTFTLSHVYQEEGSFEVIVHVTDSRGATGEATFFADVLLPGVPLEPAVKVGAAPGTTATAATVGVSATLIRAAGGPAEAEVLVAIVPPTVASGLDPGFAASNPGAITAAFDVRAINVGAGDRVVISFRYANDDFDLPVVTYFDRATRQQRIVSPRTYVVDRFARTVTLTLDGTTTPRLQDLNGTVFTISVPVNVTPAFDSASLASLLSRRSAAVAADAFISASRVEAFLSNTAALSQLPAAQEGNGSGVESEAPSGGSEAPEAPLAGHLPPVVQRLIGLQAASATASFPEVPLADTPSEEDRPKDAPTRSQPEPAGEGPDGGEALPAAGEADTEVRDTVFAGMGDEAPRADDFLFLAAVALLPSYRPRRRTMEAR